MDHVTLADDEHKNIFLAHLYFADSVPVEIGYICSKIFGTDIIKIKTVMCS